MCRLTAVMPVLALVSVVSGHEWSFGSCPYVDPMENMNVDRFLGDWYVLEQFDTTSSCLMLNYTRLSETQLSVTKTRMLAGLSQVGLGQNSYGGTIDIPYDRRGEFRVKWPLNLAGKGDYIVYDTDYTTYAGIYDCQPISGLLHRKSAAILSRTTDLDSSIVQALKSRLSSYRIDTDHFDKVNHAGCQHRDATQTNIHVDQNTFTTLVNNARDGFEGAADVIIDGIRNIGDTVSTQFPSSGGATSTSTTNNNNNNGGAVVETVLPSVDKYDVPIFNIFNTDVNTRTNNENIPGSINPIIGVPLIPIPDGDKVEKTFATLPEEGILFPEGKSGNIPIEIPIGFGREPASDIAGRTPTDVSGRTPINVPERIPTDVTRKITKTIIPETTTPTEVTTTTKIPTTTSTKIKINLIPDVSINGINSNDRNLDDSFYNIDGIDVEPVDDFVRTVVDIGI